LHIRTNMKKKQLILLFFVILLAAILRLWQLGTVPSSPDWDEAALGYNAYSIIHTGRDEYGKFLPIILRSFDDYKPALYTYLVIPTITVFGLNTFAVRLPSALFGILTVVAVYFLVDEFVQRKRKSERIDAYIPLVTAFFLAISPWHLQFSRIAFESNIGLACNVFGSLFFIKGLKRPWLLFASVFCFAASIYVYQSEKVFTPLLAIALIIIFRNELWKLPKKFLLLPVLFGIILAFPMLFVTVTDKQALARARGVSVFSDTTQLLQQNVERYAASKESHDLLGVLFNNRRVIFVRTVIANYLSHFNFNWLFISGDIARHHAPNMGLLYLFEFPLVLIGIYKLLIGDWERKTKLFFFSWFLLAAVPASVTSGVPHAVRTLNFLPIYQFFTAVGLISLVKRYSSKWKMENGKWKMEIYLKLFAICYLLFAIINFGYYLDQYFVQQNFENSKEWQFGYEQAVAKVRNIEGNYKKIIVSNQPYLDQSYMFFLYYLQYPPQQYQKESALTSGGFRENHSFGKYEFRPIDWASEPMGHDTLYIGRPSDFPASVGEVASINFLDGKKAIMIVEK
jgi:4-amino-4-deoxy-L-arabinose transferase-like glycosyltransferase